MPWAVEQQLHHGQDGEHEGRHETWEVQVRRRLQLRHGRGRARVGVQPHHRQSRQDDKHGNSVGG